MADWRQWARRLSGRKASEAGKPGTARQLGIPLGILTGIQYCRLRIARIPQRSLLGGVLVAYTQSEDFLPWPPTHGRRAVAGSMGPVRLAAESFRSLAVATARFASVYRALDLRAESLLSHIRKVALKFSLWRAPLNKGVEFTFAMHLRTGLVSPSQCCAEHHVAVLERLVNSFPDSIYSTAQFNNIS